MIDYHTFCEIHRLWDQEHLTQSRWISPKVW